MNIDITQDRFGRLEVRPSSPRWEQRFRTLLRSVQAPTQDPTLYLQSEGEVSEFLESLPSSTRRAVEEGYNTTARISEHAYATWLGHDVASLL